MTSEYMSHKNANLVKQLKLHIMKLERENNSLTVQLNDEQNKFSKLNKDYLQVKDSKMVIKELQMEYRDLQNRYSNVQRGLEVIRKTVASKKYLNNSLSKEIGNLLTEHLPDSHEQQQKKVEQSQAAFKRIKDGM
ncbi:MAG: hypothetical protein R3240_05985 [Gammaproteobacteria bacterium]|nr:hypothetical protein [Gammaproteobacteria bacterium]